MIRILKKALACLVLLSLLLTAASCGRRDNPESASDEMDETDEGLATRAVTGFHYVKMPYALTEGYRDRYGYALNDEWFYYMEDKSLIEDESMEEDSLPRSYISRVRISDGYQDQYCIIREGIEKTQKVFLADGEGNCYLFWHAYRSEERGIEFANTLEKYGPDGALLYRVDYTIEDLAEMGERLDGGTVTEDGRVFKFLEPGRENRMFGFP